MGRDIQYLATHNANMLFYTLLSGEVRVAVQIPATADCPIPFGAVGTTIDEVVTAARDSREDHIKNRDYVPLKKAGKHKKK